MFARLVADARVAEFFQEHLLGVIGREHAQQRHLAALGADFVDFADEGLGNSILIIFRRREMASDIGNRILIRLIRKKNRSAAPQTAIHFSNPCFRALWPALTGPRPSAKSKSCRAGHNPGPTTALSNSRPCRGIEAGVALRIVMLMVLTAALPV